MLTALIVLCWWVFCFCLGYAAAQIVQALDDFLTQGRAAYLAFINAMEEPHD